MAKIDDKLNLVVPVERDRGTVYVHSTPVSREVFEANFRLLGLTYSDIFGRGGVYASTAPRVASLTLKDVGRRLAAERGEDGDGGATPLLAEMKRLTLVAAPGPGGWKLLPVDEAMKQGFFDAEDWREVESVITFFTSIWWMASRRDAVAKAQGMCSAIGSSTTSSPPSEWMSSLPQSTPAETSPPTAGQEVKNQLSSIPH